MSSSVRRCNVLNFVSQFRAWLPRATSLAREVLSSSQDNMKYRFDRKTVVHHFCPGDQVLVLKPRSVLLARFLGPCVVDRIVSQSLALLNVEGRHCHVMSTRSQRHSLPWFVQMLCLMTASRCPLVANRVVG